MGSLLAYSGIAAKVKGMRSQLLTDYDFQNLSKMGSVNEAIEYLRGKQGFRSSFSNMETRNLHRGALEELLVGSEYYEFIKLYRFSGIRARKYLKLYFLQYEGIFLKAVLRGVLDHREPDVNLPLKGEFFQKHASFDTKRVAEAASMGEFLTALKGSGYYPVLQAMEKQGQVTLFDYEMAIDVHIFLTMWKKQKKTCTREEYESLCKILGTKLDMLNLIWIYRSKKYYHMKPAQIYGMLIPVHYKIKSDVWKRLTETENLEEFSVLLAETYYGKKYWEQIENVDVGKFMEGLYHALLSRFHKAESKENPYSIAIIAQYLYLKHQERRKLITAIEGIRYGIPSPMILKRIQKYN